MTKEEIKHNILFNKYKDSYVTVNYLRKKYENIVDISQLYRTIVDYQIKKYGISLNVQ